VFSRGSAPADSILVVFVIRVCCGFGQDLCYPHPPFERLCLSSWPL